MTILIVPGLYNSGPLHWQTQWERDFDCHRIVQKEWDTPVCSDWTATIQDAVTSYSDGEVVLVGHSLGCCAIARWAAVYNRTLRAALLVAPSDVDAPSYPPGTSGFAPMPSTKLSFPSLVIASSDDQYVSLDRARLFAGNWGSGFVNAGPLGHINSSSGLGSWSFGWAALQKLIE